MAPNAASDCGSGSVAVTFSGVGSDNSKKKIHIYTKIHEINTVDALIMKSLSSSIMGAIMKLIPKCNGVIQRAH